MPKKLTITQDQIKNFSIDTIKDFEGCSPALSFLKKIYGDRVEDLSLTKPDFQRLIDVDKGIWIINFCMNLLDLQHRKEFFETILFEDMKKLASKKLKKDMDEFAVGRSTYTSLSDKLIIKAFLQYSEDMQSTQGKFTRSVSSAVSLIAEAKVSKSIDKKKFNPDEFNNTVKYYANLALDFVEIFKN